MARDLFTDCIVFALSQHHLNISKASVATLLAESEDYEEAFVIHAKRTASHAVTRERLSNSAVYWC